MIRLAGRVQTEFKESCRQKLISCLLDEVRNGVTEKTLLFIGVAPSIYLTARFALTLIRLYLLVGSC